MSQDFVHFLPSLLAADGCESLRRQIEQAVERGRSVGDAADFSHSSSSIRLRALRGEQGTVDLQGIVRQAWREPLRSMVQSMLGPQPALLVDQCWGRRQFAPGRYPEHHAAHVWHQDGALHFDFVAPYPADALLKMVTCWIALTPCGEDAPGMELLRLPMTDLLPPAELDAGRIAERFPATAFWRPVCKPGDAIVFSGGTLHRTHVAPGMREDRTSVELRFVTADDGTGRLRMERIEPMAP
jgi:hypothetical protein